jgi:KDO2-lipid IV(A) lauroyltransferase
MLYFIFNRIYAYRKTVIDLNLINAFPHKRSEELWFIRSNYYRHLADLIVEGIKSFSISKNELMNRMQLQHESYALLKEYGRTEKNIFIVLGHYGNWEWASLLAGLQLNRPCIAIYAPPSNKAFENFLVKSRSRFNCELVAMNHMKRVLTAVQQQPSMVAFVADQTPVDIANAYHTKFMHLQTPFYKGFDTLARKSNAIVLYLSIRKLNRGFYELNLETITEHAETETENYIAEKFVRLLERDICNRPEYWLWSHRRWKRAGILY